MLEYQKAVADDDRERDKLDAEVVLRAAEIEEKREVDVKKIEAQMARPRPAPGGNGSSAAQGTSQ